MGERAHASGGVEASSRPARKGRGRGADMNEDERELWHVADIVCVIISCCSGAELQLRRVGAGAGGDILLRELYPMKSDLYERARELEARYRAEHLSSNPSK